MKKLRLNKIFHWLYAILMFLPFISAFLFVIINFGSGNTDITPSSIAFDFVESGLFGSADQGTLGDSIYNVFDYVNRDILGFTDSDSVLYSMPMLFTYWVSLSIVYLIFDVLIFIVNVAHSWIDKGADKLC